MKMFHLSDLHLGKKVNGFSMIEDQAYILEEILHIADEEKPDAVIIAGDVYDKAIPTTDAVTLLDDFLTRLSGKNIPVFMISGNHDSPERLSFASRLLADQHIFLTSVYDGNAAKICLEDEYGPVFVYLLPFIKPSTVRYALANEVATYEDALKIAIERMNIDTKARNVLVAHQFVTGALRCESEEILVGGLDNVDASLFDDFDYVALGHIHSPQNVGRDTIRYCGTPLKYSFSEASQEKSVTVVELKEKGNVSVNLIPLKPLHDMRVIRGTYMELTSRSFYENINTLDYIKAVLTDEEDILDGLQKMRVIYPNIMQFQYGNLRTGSDQPLSDGRESAMLSELELFEEFYSKQNNQPMSDIQKEYVERLISSLKEGGRS